MHSYQSSIVNEVIRTIFHLVIFFNKNFAKKKQKRKTSKKQKQANSNNFFVHKNFLRGENCLF